ncbi:hypothetical protein LEP1GSC016_2330 [Leptospira borgpetersenii serovar Hardjo-bovis str. Sponselee]|uniref:Uncharacterized protein n=1 Tax=Leptospira borgpetersenii serovar Hardjo-bovis str. Sponselee TaxID=1303729 RepID=M6BSU6_LEPBO|nr:hypothetical protein LEP1GSC016_2330 [Leptospira borgpetersenii serovar Hardjo-bovis str. Sponselee]
MRLSSQLRPANLFYNGFGIPPKRKVGLESISQKRIQFFEYSIFILMK